MKKILIIDDEKPISDIIKFNLNKEGYELISGFGSSWSSRYNGWS